MLSKSLQIMIISVSVFCMGGSFVFAANVQPSELTSSVHVDGLRLEEISFWGLPYPYGYAWRPCYVWRSVQSRYGHRRWYRIRVSEEDCRP